MAPLKETSPDDLSADELAYYYTGFAAVLRLYRRMTIVGWLAFASGLAALPLGCGQRSFHPLVDLALAGALMAAGLFIVWQALAMLETYVEVPFPGRERGSGLPGRLQEIMAEVRRGGWQETAEALHRLEELGAEAALPPLHAKAHPVFMTIRQRTSREEHDHGQQA